MDNNEIENSEIENEETSIKFTGNETQSEKLQKVIDYLNARIAANPDAITDEAELERLANEDDDDDDDVDFDSDDDDTFDDDDDDDFDLDDDDTPTNLAEDLGVTNDSVDLDDLDDLF